MFPVLTVSPSPAQALREPSEGQEKEHQPVHCARYTDVHSFRGESGDQRLEAKMEIWSRSPAAHLPMGLQHD